MSKRVCLFVDGENFRHSICDLFQGFDDRDYLPKNGEWGRLFDYIAASAVPKSERVRTYWYVIAEIIFFPYKFPNASRDTSELKELLSKHEPFKKEFEDLESGDLIKRMIEIVGDLNNQRNWVQKNLQNRWSSIQNEIARRFDSIEFRRSGSIFYNLFERRLRRGSEKAVDVKLASDMIILKDIYDVAIIVTGDQDYVPAVQIVKDFGKHVVNVAFETRGGRLLPGGAKRLNQVTDWSFHMKHDVLSGYLHQG